MDIRAEWGCMVEPPLLKARRIPTYDSRPKPTLKPGTSRKVRKDPIVHKDPIIAKSMPANGRQRQTARKSTLGAVTRQSHRISNRVPARK